MNPSRTLYSKLFDRMNTAPRPMLLMLIVMILGCSSQKEIPVVNDEITTIYLVRHAEKVDDSKDPDLNSAGKQRAKNLSIRLGDKNIQAIYSTDYKRTRQTAMPTAELLDLEMNIYNPKDHSIIIEQLKNQASGNVLVVGHSNSTPSLVNQILGEDQYKSLDHEEYGKIFVLVCDRNFICQSRIETY